MNRSKLAIIILGTACVLLTVTATVLCFVKIYPQKIGFSVLNVYEKASPGYGWVNGQPVWLRGKRHDHNPHIYAGAGENTWQTDYGYVFTDKNSLDVKWVPDLFFNTELGTLKTGKNTDTFFVKKSCEACKGVGGSQVECPACRGQIRIIIRNGCQNCNASGSIVCRNCNGSGQQRCTFQRNCTGRCQNCVNGVVQIGDMRHRCFYCHGTGRDPFCKGTGKMSCLQCGGQGKQNCLICRGNGATESWSICDKCSGRGIKISKCRTCAGNGHLWENISKDPIRRLQLELCEKQVLNEIAAIGRNSPENLQTSSAEKNDAGVLQELQRRQMQQQLLQMQLELFNSSSNIPPPSFQPAQTSYGSSNSSKRTCSIHGVEYDIRFGGCAMCRQPDFGSGKTANIKCYIHGVYYDPALGCPRCR